MSSPTQVKTASGFSELHIASTTLASQAEKAIQSCGALCAAYPEIVSFSIITDQPNLKNWEPLKALPKAHTLDECQVYSKQSWLQLFASIEHLSPRRAGWYYQQLLKIARLFALAVDLSRFHNHETTGLLIWDADTRLVSPIPLADHRSHRSYSYFTRNLHERHTPFYLVNEQLTGLPIATHPAYSNIVQFVALSVRETLSLATFLGLDLRDTGYMNHLADRLLQAIKSTALTNDALFSEYELIGLFKQQVLHCESRRVKFIRVNRRHASPLQYYLMRCAGIAHFTSEEWHGEYAKFSYLHLVGHLMQQYFPAVQRLKAALR